ncbi:MAG: single-stranded DNA-binding protein [Comamonadaceae bacterium]|nr:single-stranded DNA-binding protein [Comamonadaceae bacterium]
MANVLVIQRNAHLAGPVRVEFVDTRDGRVTKATLTAISNTWRGSGEAREQEATAIQWTLWGTQAENAAACLDRGSHVNVVGRLKNNVYEKAGDTVFGWDFTVEDIDFLDSRADAEARRAGAGGPPPQGHGGASGRSRTSTPGRTRS